MPATMQMLEGTTLGEIALRMYSVNPEPTLTTRFISFDSPLGKINLNLEEIFTDAGEQNLSNGTDKTLAVALSETAEKVSEFKRKTITASGIADCFRSAKAFLVNGAFPKDAAERAGKLWRAKIRVDLELP